MPVSLHISRKETIFEGYYTAYYECSWLEKKPQYARRGITYERLRKFFMDRLELNLKEPDKESSIVNLDDLIPKEVYRKLLRNPNKRFRFKFVVEVEEV